MAGGVNMELWVKEWTEGRGVPGYDWRLATDAEKLAAAATLDGAVGNQWCLDHKIAWVDGGDCWAAGINGIDACRIVTTTLVIPLPDKETTDE